MRNDQPKNFLQRIQQEIICPISLMPMENPVVISDGHSYQEEKIKKWFQQKHTSPRTNLRISTFRAPNIALKNLTQRIRQEYPILLQQHNQAIKQKNQQIKFYKDQNIKLRKIIEEDQQHYQKGMYRSLKKYKGYYQKRYYQQMIKNRNLSDEIKLKNYQIEKEAEMIFKKNEQIQQLKKNIINLKQKCEQILENISYKNKYQVLLKEKQSFFQLTIKGYERSQQLLTQKIQQLSNKVEQLQTQNQNLKKEEKVFRQAFKIKQKQSLQALYRFQINFYSMRVKNLEQQNDLLQQTKKNLLNEIRTIKAELRQPRVLKKEQRKNGDGQKKNKSLLERIFG